MYPVIKHTTKRRRSDRLVLLFALPLPQDVLRVIKTYLFIDDPLYFHTKISKMRIFRSLYNLYLSDFEPDERLEWVGYDDNDEIVEPQETVAYRWFNYDGKPPAYLCLQCGNYLCTTEVCFGHFAKSIHCLCSHHTQRFCMHYPVV